MKFPVKLFIYSFLVLISITSVFGLAVSGKQTRFNIDFEPNYYREDEFIITNKEGYPSTYIIRPEYQHGADLSTYFTITPDRIENVPDGGSAHFKVKLSLPESLDVPGESYGIVSVEIDPSQGGFRAYPAIGLSYRVFVLYPYEFIRWSFSAPNMNTNETKDFSLVVQNLGEPEIANVFADIDVISLENNETVRILKTDAASLKPKEKKTISAKFDSLGLLPGNYRAVPKLHWNNDISGIDDANFNKLESKLEFRIGIKEVKILNFTKYFEKDSINQMDILVESAWNTKIDDLYSEITIYDKTTGDELKHFKSITTELDAWETKSFEAYFDTKGLEEGDYKAGIELFYDGGISSEDGMIIIGGDSGAKTFDEMPGTFKVDFAKILTPINIMILLLAIFLAVNLYLAITLLKRKKEEADPAVVEYVTEMKKTYSDSHIKEEMLKKGWKKEKIEAILKEAGKK